MVNVQTLIFLQSCLLGACLGLFYDVFRILRIAVKTPAAVVFVEDVFYFTVCAAATFLFMMNCVDGRIRGFIVLGELLGAVLYYCTLGALLFRLSNVIIHFIKKALHLLFRIFIHPFCVLFRFLGCKLKKGGLFVGRKAKKTTKNLNSHLKHKRVLLYNNFIRRKQRIRPEQLELKQKGRGKGSGKKRRSKRKKETPVT